MVASTHRFASQVNISFRKLWAPLALSLFLVPACRPHEGRVDVEQRPLVVIGFEKSDSLSATALPALTTEKSHTGRFSIRTDSLHKSITLYQGKMGRLCAHQPRRFIVSAWVWVPSFKDDASLIFAISNAPDPAPFFQQTLYLSDTGSFGKWKLITQSIDLPNSTHPQSQLIITLAGQDSNQPVYVDDLEVAELW